MNQLSAESVPRHIAFRAVLASTITFFLVSVAAIVIGLVKGGNVTLPSLANASAPTIIVFFLGMFFPAAAALALLVAWVRFSSGRYRLTTLLAMTPWMYFAVFALALVMLLHRR